MGHEIETMFSGRGIKPWHFAETCDLTTIVDHVPRAAEAIKLAGLDWSVSCEPVFFKSAADAAAKKGARTLVPNSFAVVRDTDQKPLATVGSKWVPLQNTDAFQFLDNLVDTGLEYETAGSLRGGQQVFIAAKLPQTINIGGDDKHELYLFARNAFDGRNAVTIGVTPVRIVCMNTLNLALKGAKRTWSVPHLGTMAGRLEEAREALDLSFAYADAFEREGNRLVAQKLSDKAFDEFLASLTEDMGERSGEKARDNIRGIYTTSTTVAGTGHTGTAWGALNAAGEYFDWVRPTRTDEARLIGSLEGVAVKARDRALALLS